MTRLALITGAGRGIGAACARALAAAGCHVVLTSRTRAELDATARAITDAGGEAHVHPADLADPAAIDALFTALTDRFGHLDVLVNAAAVIEPAPLEAIDLAAYERVMAVNVRAVFLCCQRAFPLMRDRGGAIINLSSLGGVRSTQKFPGLSTYTASKAAVIGLTEALAVEGRPHRIRVNAIAPGAVDTVMLRTAAPFLRTSTTPDDIAPTAVFLADPTRSGKISGAVLEVFSNE
ncbi:MAG: SDR family NAD(P)-dependent oxidoreductase [bacterium]